MQPRFCRCGAAVYVRYLHLRGRRSWRPIFWSTNGIFGTSLMCCPHCRASLHIDELR